METSTDTSFRNAHIADPRLSRNMSYILSTNSGLEKKPTRELHILGHEMVPLQSKHCAKLEAIKFRNHSCTDVHCLIIFVCFIIAWVYIASYALSEGDLNNVLIPTDSSNAKCGLDSGVRDKKMLFFFNLDKCLDPLTPITGCGTKQICVKSCPQTSFIWQEDKIEKADNLIALKENLICDSIVDKNKLNTLDDIEIAISNDHCSGWYLKSKSLFNHCIWDFTDNICKILPQTLSGRKRRSDASPETFIDITPFQTKLAEFVRNTKSMCMTQNRSSTSSMNIVLKEKIKHSKSITNRIIAAIISHYNYNGKDILAEHVAIDLQTSWKVIILAFFINLCLILLFITLLRWLAAPLVWVSICGVIIGLSFTLVYSFLQYRLWSAEPHVPQHGINLMAKLQNIWQSADFWLYVTTVLGTFLIIILLVVIVIRKRIKIAIAIIKEASKAITNIRSSIFFPIFPGFLYILVAIVALLIMLYLSSIGEFSFIVVRHVDNSTNSVAKENCICTGPMPKPYQLGDKCDPELFENNCHVEYDLSKPCVQTSCSFNEIVKSKKTQCFMLFNIFAFLWITFFISAYEDMVLACTFSIWYWTFNKKDIPKLPLLKAIWLTTAYHLGTLAFGSLILSICRIIRYILEFIEKKAKLYNNALTRAILCCMQCFFWVLENFLRFLNRNAYITCAIHSTSFCSSSRKAFNLITQNILRVYAVDKVSDFMFFLSKVLVTGCTAFTTYLFLKTYPNIIPVHYPIVPVALVVIIAYIMAHFIFSTYSMAVDTLFFCFLEDSIENDGSAEKPFYMSKELSKLLGKSKAKKKQVQR